jgi:extracellular elastinolytic metalloproteinase
VNWVHASGVVSRQRRCRWIGPGGRPADAASRAWKTALASPFGWHDTNGIAGPEFTDTRGNNVQAQTDPTGFDAVGIRADGGTSLLFDFPANFSATATSNAAASVTSLFYLANVCHDIFYRHGFDESAGNFQTNNYGRGGSGGDAIMADAQDAASTNNASFSSPPDGTTPRMEMGLATAGATLEVTAPISIAGAPSTLAAAFGPSIAGTITGTVVLGTDDTISGPSATDCCGALTNAPTVSGKIALIDRGDCNFTVKVKNAQDAGAIAVIMVNNAGNALVTMSGDDPTITIPSVFIGQSDGQLIKNAIAQGVQVRIEGLETPDTSFDATVVVHEFAHGVTTRLTGGPSDASSLDGTIPGGMGEGWSDFFALVFTAKPADTRNTRAPRRPVFLQPGGHPQLSLQQRSLPSIRSPTPTCAPAPRSTTVGEVWSAMLWEVYWNLVEARGFDTSLYGGPGGNNLALQLVIDGCKLQPSNPNFLQARDAILQADLVNNAGSQSVRHLAGLRQTRPRPERHGRRQRQRQSSHRRLRHAARARHSGSGRVKACQT